MNDYAAVAMFWGAPRGTDKAEGDTEPVPVSASATVKKSDEELRVVWSEVYIPDQPDTEGDFMTAETIRTMGWGFVAKGFVNAIDVNHDQQEDEYAAVVVESFIARKGDPDFIEGAWVLAVHVPDDELWDAIRKGDINGFSLEGLARSREVDLDFEAPPEVVGKTASVNGHEHTFYVELDAQGNVIRGHTDEVAGHTHTIRGATVTERSGGHTHRFSVAREVADHAA